ACPPRRWSRSPPPAAMHPHAATATDRREPTAAPPAPPHCDRESPASRPWRSQAPARSKPKLREQAPRCRRSMRHREPASPQTRAPSLSNLHDRRRRPPEHLRLIHLLGMRRRGHEGSGRRRAEHVRELVIPFRQARREQIHPVVTALDVIESAALPPAHPIALRFILLLLLGEIRRRRREPRLDRLRARRNRIRNGDEAALLRVPDL